MVGGELLFLKLRGYKIGTEARGGGKIHFPKPLFFCPPLNKQEISKNKNKNKTND